MKKIRYIVPGLLLAAALCACENKVKTEGPATEKELTFSPRVLDPVSGTRAAGSSFFEPGYGIEVDITSSNPNVSYQEMVYTYFADGIFRGNPGYRFTLDDNYITKLTATWPTGDIRSNGIVTDQRELENFRLADWLTATASLDGLMPTDAPVPLDFIRDNTMLEFELAGQNTSGLAIDSLLLSLEINDQPTACWAYCDTDDGHAYLILEPGTELVGHAGELIGTLWVNTEDIYYIILPELDFTLAKGTRYLVTLVPQGYDMTVYLFINGWITEEEAGLGIPFAQPDADGNFHIETPEQLITMSYLIRHYNNPATFDWRSSTYILSDDLVVSQEWADRYIPVPLSLFSGQVQTEDGTVVSSIAIDNGGSLDLYVP